MTGLVVALAGLAFLAFRRWALDRSNMRSTWSVRSQGRPESTALEHELDELRERSRS